MDEDLAVLLTGYVVPFAWLMGLLFVALAAVAVGRRVTLHAALRSDARAARVERELSEDHIATLDGDG